MSISRIGRTLVAPLLLAVTACQHNTSATSNVLSASGNECFPIERLAVSDRRLAEQVLLEFSDREGLYTLANGLKPISSDVRDMTFTIAPKVDSAKLAELERLRRVSTVLSCGDIGVFVQVFTATSAGRDSSTQRHATLVLYHRASLARAVQRQRAFFATIGITPSADPRDIVNAVENAPRDARWRGYGYMFGYPEEAVDFFVRAGIEGDSTGKLVPRDFKRVETWFKYPESTGGPRTVSSFVYAVPKGAVESAGDRALNTQARPTFTKYDGLRATFVKPDSSGAVALWRSWMGR